MSHAWFVLVPPIITLVLAAFTQKIVPSLLSGIFAACLLVYNFSLQKALYHTIYSVWQTSQIGDILNPNANHATIFLFIFLTLLSIMVTMIVHTGGANAFGTILTKRLKTKKDVESTSILFSLAIPVDDYLSNLTIGNVMRPIANKFKVARVKLAFLVNSLSAPLVLINPLSSWFVPMSAQLGAAGINMDATSDTLILSNPFSVYLQSIPYMFYSFILLFSVIFIVRYGISFGTMRKHEQIAEKTGNLFGGKTPLTSERQSDTNKDESILDLLIPFGTLFVTAIIGLLYTGNWYLFGGTNSLLMSLKDANISLVLVASSLFGTLASIVRSYIYKILSPKEINAAVQEGIQLIVPSLMLLCLAWTLSGLLANDLKTGHYLASLFVGKIPLPLLPFMLFIISFITTISIGSSWGTMSIMTALAVPMTLSLMNLSTGVPLEDVGFILVVLGSIFSGAIAGNTIAPIADAPIMASTSVGAYLMDHVKTQFLYSIAPLLGTSISYLMLGWLFATNMSLALILFISFGTGLTVSLGTLLALNKMK